MLKVDLVFVVANRNIASALLIQVLLDPGQLRALHEVLEITEHVVGEVFLFLFTID